MVFKKCTFLPCKQAHTLSPLEQIFYPPFTLPNGKGWAQKLIGNKKWGKFVLGRAFCTHVTIVS